MKRLILIINLLFAAQFAFAQSFSTAKQEQINNEIIKLLKNYENLSTFKAENGFMNVNLQQQFFSLFYSDTSYIFNDIALSKPQEQYNVTDYLQLIRANYESALSVKLQNIQIEYPYLRISKTEYIANVSVHKKIAGFQKNNQIYSFDHKIWITVWFDKSMQVFKIYRIGIIPYEPEIYTPKEDKGYALQFIAAPSKTKIEHDLSQYSANLSSETGTNVNFSLIYRQPIFSGLAILLGIGKSKYISEFKLNNYINEYESNDLDNEKYVRIVSSDEIIENEEISYIDFQLGIQYRFLTNKVKPFFSISGIYSKPSKSKYIGSGTFNYQGYYPQYNLTLYNLEQYNFAENKDISYWSELNVKSNFSINSELGIEIFLSESLNFILGIYYRKGLTNISNYEPSYILSDSPDNYTGIMNASANTTTGSFGVSIGFNIIL
ncbi:MAG: hypothetical protein L3J45_10245 [Flavobacteriaceae bacterium]|nr:hypothetical protein [Flavobacteriaceae bacterium]